MADSITAMGSSPIYFPLVPDWANPPSLGFGISRDLVSYPGTAANLESITEYAPLNFSLSMLVTGKDDEYELLDFFHNIRGMNKRFWIEYPLSQFRLKTKALLGSTSIECYGNGFDKISQGNERCFWAMKNGDLVVRKMTQAVYSTTTEILSITIDSQLDRDIDNTDYFVFGRFLLVRLEEDTVNQDIETNEISSWEMKVTELPTEYDAEEAS